MATTNLTNLKANAFTDVVSTIVNTTNIISTTPKVTSITYPGDDTAANTGGGQTVTLTGTGFNSGASILINSTYASVVTVVSNTSITFTAPAQNAGTYTLYVINTDGGTAISIPGISYSGTPTWTTAAGTLGTSYETVAISNSLTATGDATISYSLFSGTLPPGSSLNSSTGLLSGTSQATASSTTYNFTIRATDGQNQDTDRAFSITINPDVVSWSSPADNSSTSVYEYATITPVTLAASSAAGKSITFTANSLPTGVTISGNTISGTPTVIANTFTQVTANSANTFKTATKNISFIVNPDVVTWSSPADGTSTALSTGAVMSNVTLSATSAAGKSITYTANTLPTGVTITGAVVNGTPTVDGTTNSLITATATTTNRTATRNFTWVVSVANDIYFKNTTLLLNGETTVNTFIKDASNNNFGLTINGDTRPTLFNPYRGDDGYYSNFFDGTGDYLTAPASTAWNFTGDWTFECWIYPTAITGYHTFLGQWGAPDTVFIWKMNSSGRMYLENQSTAITATTTTIVVNKWQHIALTRSSNTIRMFVDGVVDSTTASRSGTYYSSGAMYVGASAVAEAFNGYINSMRILKGTALYTTTFTPSTTPLTAIANTSLLTCQSNRLIDNSTNNFAITKVGDTTISPNIPFTANSSYSTYGSTYFDGTGDYLSLSSAIVPATGNFTIEFWIYSLTNAGSAQRAVYAQWVTGESGRFMFGLDQTSSSRIWLHYNGTDYVGTTNGILPNTWAHLALVRNGDVFTMYVNGVLNSTNTFAGASLYQVAGNIGGMGGSFNVNAQVSNLRIVVGTALYTAAFTPSTTPLTAIANTSLLTLQYNGGATNQGIIDNSNFNNIITRNGNTSQGTFSPYSVTGWSNYFDGTGDYLSIDTNTAFDLSTSDFTVECWVYFNGSNNSRGFFAAGNSSRSGIGYQISASGILQFIYGNGTTCTFVAGTNALQLNTWIHVVTSRVGSNARVYINGTLEITVTSSNFGAGSYSCFVGIGYGINAGNLTLGSPINGYISNLRIIKGTALYTATFTPPTTPLTAIANTQLLTCQSNRFIDNSSNNLALTRTGDVSVQAFGPFGSIPEATPISYSNYFDGSGDTLTIPSPTTGFSLGTGEFTIEMWIYKTSAVNAVLVDARSAASGLPWVIAIDASNFPYLYDNTVYASTVAVTLNSWSHVAVVRTSGVLKIFVNGVQGYSASYSANLDRTAGLVIGDTVHAAAPMLGYISNLRIVKGTAVYTTAFTPPTTPLTAIANTSLLTCQSTRMIDNSTNAFTITAVGDTKPKQHNPFGYTAQSAASYTPSLHGGSAYFDGTGDYLTVSGSTVGFGTNAYTIEFWIYRTAAGGLSRLFERGTGGTDFSMDLSTAGVLTINNNTGIAGSTCTTSIPLNTWTYITLVRTSTSASGTAWYINGVASGTFTHSTNIASGGTLSITTGGLTGYLSNLRVTNGTALYTSNFVPPAQTLGNYSTSVPSQLLLNFNNGGIMDQHSTNVLETVGNAQLSTAVKKYGNASMYFDGTGDYLKIPYSPSFNFGTGNFTVEGWIYLNSLASSYYVMAGTYTTGTTDEWLIQISNGNTIRFLTSVGTSFYSATITTSTWYHIAAVRNESTITLYVNGTSVGSYTNSNSIGSVSKVLYIGVQNISTWPMNGYIDDLRITKGYARYTTTFTPPTSALLTY